MQNLEWYVRGAFFTFKEKHWSELGDPVEWVGEDGNIPILETNTYRWARYKNGNWTYSENWNFSPIDIISNASTSLFNADKQSSDCIRIYLFKDGGVGGQVHAHNSLLNWHEDNDPGNPGMYNRYAEMNIYLSIRNPPLELEYLVEYLNNMSDNLVSLDERINQTEQIDITKPISNETLKTINEQNLNAMELATKQLWNTSGDVLKYTILSTWDKIHNIFKSNN